MRIDRPPFHRIRGWHGQVLLPVVLALITHAASADTPLRFDFGPGPVAPGFNQVLPITLYTPERGYGLEPGHLPTAIFNSLEDSLTCDALTSDKPFLFSIKLPEGNYHVTVLLGDQSHPTDTTIKSELRRLSIEKLITAPGQFAKHTFAASVRTPAMPNGNQVRLKERERTMEWVNWDEKLTLEFNGTRPTVCSVEIKPMPDLPTVFLLGDSTVCDQPAEPWNSWGQMLPRFFNNTVAVANHAQSGESLKSSLSARRLDKVVGQMKRGDYLFIQFGHNDMKERGDGIGPFTSYKSDLKKYVAAAKGRGATPVLVTSMHRKSLGADGKITNTLNDYPEAARQTAREENVPLIDLHEMSARLYEALGKARIDKAFQDGSHHNNFGSYELAKCVAEGVRTNIPDLAKHLAPDFNGFDPSKPDDPDKFVMPSSPALSTRKPDGN